MAPPPAAGHLSFAPIAARGLAVLAPEDLTRGNLTIELGVSLWMHRTRTDLSGVRDELLNLRQALLATSGLDLESEPIPLLARDLRTAVLSLTVYLDGLIDRAAHRTRLGRSEVVERALHLL